MKANRALASTLLLAALLLPLFCFAGSTTGATEAAGSQPGLYTVSSSLATSTTPAVDISVSSAKEVQLVTITAEAGVYRAVLTDAEGQILRTRSVEGEASFDLYALPTGTYRLAILNGSGELQMQQTLVKR